MARDLFSDVTAFVRKLVDDRDYGPGVAFPDSELYDFGTARQKEIFEEMVSRGIAEAQATLTRNVGTSDTKINWSVPGGQVLPDDFVVPEKLWEKKQGDPDINYVPMTNQPEIPPDLTAADNLLYWAWIENEVRFAYAPTQARTVRIVYRRHAPKISAASDVLYVPGSYLAMAWGIVALCDESRGEANQARTSEGKYQAALARLLNIKRKPEQRRVRRRTPYSALRSIYR